mmetsp:Transcript_23449/g.56439  ORF Transcript_23449/g.56439 Transcript_23449/m.56439 type:complete len:412 (+) Transcript_23449:1028-2263(+)
MRSSRTLTTPPASLYVRWMRVSAACSLPALIAVITEASEKADDFRSASPCEARAGSCRRPWGGVSLAHDSECRRGSAFSPSSSADTSGSDRFALPGRDLPFPPSEARSVGRRHVLRSDMAIAWRCGERGSALLVRRMNNSVTRLGSCSERMRPCLLITRAQPVTVCRLMNRSCAHRITKACRSTCTKHLVRGKTPSICRSAVSPVAMGSMFFGVFAGGVRPRIVRNCRMDAAVRGARRVTSRWSVLKTRRFSSWILREATRRTMVDGETEWALATRKMRGRWPVNQSFSAPTITWSSSIERPKKRKKTYTPEAASPNPNVLQTSDEISHALMSRMHTYVRTRASSIDAISAASSVRWKGLIVRRRARNMTLTRMATSTRACSNSSLISTTAPVNVSLRSISIGSHQKAAAS